MLCKWKMCAAVVWETEPWVKRDRSAAILKVKSTVAVTLQLRDCETFICVICVIYCAYDLSHRSGFFAWFEARSERGLVCSVQARTCTDGIQDGEPDPYFQLIFSIASVRKSHWVVGVSEIGFGLNWKLIELLFLDWIELKLFIELNNWTHIWTWTWV